MSQPILSIIVPVYNVQEYLDACINSLLSQTYERIEIILVDDGSTDDSGRICERYASLDPRIRVIHKENGGLSDARNAGIEIAKGEYIGFVDSDDWISTKMYEVLLRNLEVSKADIAVCERVAVYPDRMEDCGGTDSICVLNQEESLDILYANKKYGSYACNKLFRKELFKSIRFPKGRLFEDIYIMHELFGLANRVVFIDTGLYFYLQRPNSIVNSNNLDNWEEYVDALVFKRNARYSVGRESLVFSNMLDAAVTIKTVMKDCPKEKKTRFLRKKINHIIRNERNLQYGLKTNLRAILIVYCFPLYRFLLKIKNHE